MALQRGNVEESRMADSGKQPGNDGAPLMTVADLARRLSLSARIVRRHDLAGKIPQALRIGGALRWRPAEIQEWIDEGCPQRERWETIWSQRRNRGRAVK